jgi:acyl carrier protein
MEALKGYISREILDGKDMGLNGSTPLLEWGIINSMEIARLVSFIQDQYSVKVPNDKIVAEYFVDLASITNLVLELE